jgi:hypothetical protein
MLLDDLWNISTANWSEAMVKEWFKLDIKTAVSFKPLKILLQLDGHISRVCRCRTWTKSTILCDCRATYIVVRVANLDKNYYIRSDLFKSATSQETKKQIQLRCPACPAGKKFNYKGLRAHFKVHKR